MSILRSRFSGLAVAVCLAAGRAAAQQPEPAPAAAVAENVADSPLVLQVEATGLALDEGSVRQAIMRELGLEGASAPAGAEQLAIGLRVISGGELTVTLHAGDGRDVSRSVAAPARPDEVPEVTALLVGNLARDEASDVLARLRTPEPEPSPAPVSVASSTAGPAEPELPLESVNLSLAYPLTLRSHSDERRFALELGLFYSRIGALSGVGLNLLGAQALGPVSGVMIAGLGYWHGGPAEGVRIGGVLGVGGTGLVGASIAGVATIERGDVSGFQLSSGLNLAAGNVDGAQVTGVANVAGDVAGVQLGTGLNLARSVQGVQVSGGANLARGSLDGVQVSSGLNLAERINGLQLSLVNIGGDVDGAQIGILNVARDVTGVQLGLVNVARQVDGVSLALVPYSERGRTQGVVWFATSMPINLGVRFYAGPLYVMPTFSYDPRANAVILDPIDGDYAPGLAVGYRLNLGRGFADLDVHYSNRSTGSRYEESEIDLRYRLLGGIQVTRAFGVFAGGGVRHHVSAQGLTDPYVKPELSVGLQLL